MDKQISVFKEVVSIMPEEFDAHDFILQLLKNNPISYFSILRSLKENVTLTNAQISNHLKNNTELYALFFIGKTVSPDIYLEPNECALFKKNN